jgi:hypothetical protein
MDASTIINLLALLFSLIAIITSAIIATRQSRLMQHANTLSILVELFREFRSGELKQSVGYVEKKLWEEHPPGKISLRQLPQPAVAHSSRIASFFSNVGILVANGIIDGLTVTSYMGGTILRTWSCLEPYIRQDRKIFGRDDYHQYFEHLACIADENRATNANLLPNLKRMPTSVKSQAQLGSVEERPGDHNGAAR